MYKYFLIIFLWINILFSPAFAGRISEEACIFFSDNIQNFARIRDSGVPLEYIIFDLINNGKANHVSPKVIDAWTDIITNIYKNKGATPLELREEHLVRCLSIEDV